MPTKSSTSPIPNITIRTPGYPALERFAASLHNNARLTLSEAIDEYGPRIVQAALGWDESLSHIRRPLVRKLVSRGGFELVAQGLGAPVIDLMRDLAVCNDE